MGNSSSRDAQGDTGRDVGRAQAVTEIKRRHIGKKLPVGSRKTDPQDCTFITVSDQLLIKTKEPLFSSILQPNTGMLGKDSSL